MQKVTSNVTIQLKSWSLEKTLYQPGGWASPLVEIFRLESECHCETVVVFGG